MADQCPEKKEIEQIFNRLRTSSANKVCFDCNAKNPTWASVTYGVFICIDCSAVHRSLGVHLTFVRSTQLDTNWTWLQMRQMQLGGNANASQFFRQHNCNTNDSQQKYNSRVASMYRDKLKQLAQQAMNTYGTQAFIDVNNETVSSDIKEPDFFDNITDDFNSNVPETLPSLKTEVVLKPNANVNVNETPSERKPTIGVRKVQPKRSGLGAKKGLGATKVSTNFAEIEKEANLLQQKRNEHVESFKKGNEQSKEDSEETMISMRLAYKDLSLEQSKEEERLKSVDPKKAKQVERLGMGFSKARSGVSHSALSDMKTIEQENLDNNSKFSMSKSSFEKESDGFFDDFSFSSNSMYDRSGERQIQSFMDSKNTTKQQDWEIIEPETNNRNVHSMFNPEIKTQPTPVKGAAPEDAAQKKFGNVKSISSDQYFNEGVPEYERNANLSRFQGSNSISSADYFGDGSNNRRGNTSYTAQQLQNIDLDDVKQSVRQGVSKVAGKLSSLANGVMTTLQDKYGY